MHCRTPSLALTITFLATASAKPATLSAGTGNAIFAVNSTADGPDANPGDGVCSTIDGVCTLRAAIDEANAGPGGSVISLPTGTYHGGLDIAVSLTLSGAGATVTRIDGGGPVIHVAHGAAVDIRDVTIQNGALDGGYGAGIANQGDVTLTNVTISGNANVSYGSPAALGGGFSNYSDANGRPAYATLTSVTINDNRVYTGHGNPASGGGIFNQRSCVLTLINSTLSGNTTDSAFPGSGLNNGAGIANEGNATLSDVTIDGNNAVNVGGGIASSGYVTLTNVTISRNLAGDSGGGLSATIGSLGGNATLTNVTISDNISNGPGGGIFNSADSTLANVTISGNMSGEANGGGIFHLSHGGIMQAKNTIVANNLGGDCSRALLSLGHNLSSDSSCGFELSNTDPMLGPLQNNGGPTFTRALLPGSPAINAGSPDCPPPATDQRGVTRAGRCDIGAFEFLPFGCIGDCDNSGRVTVGEIISLVNIALGNAAVSTCPVLAPEAAGAITVARIVEAVNNALHGCSTF